MKRIVLGVVILLLAMMAFTTSAQEALEYDQTVTGEITDEAYERLYTFKGAAGDSLMIEMKGVDPLEGFSEPELVLTGPDGNVLVNTADIFQFFGGYGAKYLAIELPAEGIYTVTATRTGGADGTGVGPFTLTIYTAVPLESGKAYTGTLSSEGGYNYYVYRGDQRFSISYTKVEGGYWPEVSVNALDDSGALTGIGYLLGDAMTTGTIGVFRDGQTYFILVGQLTTSFMSGQYYMDEEYADYEIQLVTEK